MGLFSGDTKHYVFSNAQQVIGGDAGLSAEESVLFSIMNDVSLPDLMVASRLHSMDFKVNKAREYAKDGYYLGLADQNKSIKNTVDYDVLEDVIALDQGLAYGCYVNFNYKAPLSAAFVVIPFLLKDRGYDFLSNQIETDKRPDDWTLPSTYNLGSEVCQTSKEITIDSVSFTEDLLSINIFYSAYLSYHYYTGGQSAHTNDDPFKITKEYPLYYLKEWTETLAIPDGLIPHHEYYIVGYQEYNITGGIVSETVLNPDYKEYEEIDPESNPETIEVPITSWWYYALGVGKYPEIEEAAEAEEINNSYPVIPVRYENQFINAVDDPDLYPSVCQMADKLGLDFDLFTEKLEENPDIGEMDHAYLVFGIDLQTENSVALSYLMDFFIYLESYNCTSVWEHLNSYSVNQSYDPREERRYHSALSTIDPAPIVNSTLIGDTNVAITSPSEVLSLKEYGLHTGISYSRITIASVEGVIGEIGKVTKEFIGHTRTVVFNAERGEKGKTTSTETYYNLFLKKQISETSYKTVEVGELVHVNTIYKDRSVFTYLNDLLENEDNHNFIIPLHYSTVQLLSHYDINELYQNSFYLVINSHVEEEVKWYETGFFKFLLTAATLVIAVFTQQWQLVGLVGAIEAGMTAFIMFVLPRIIAALIFKYLADLLVDVLGPEFAFLAAVVMTIAGLATGKMLGAQDLLALGPATIKSANEKINDMIKGVAAEYSEFMIDAEAKQEILDEKYEQLNKEYLLPFSYLQPDFNHPKPGPVTSPDQIYNTVRDKNPGTKVFDHIAHYADVALTLPRMSIN